MFMCSLPFLLCIFGCVSVCFVWLCAVPQNSWKRLRRCALRLATTCSGGVCCMVTDQMGGARSRGDEGCGLEMVNISVFRSLTQHGIVQPSACAPVLCLFILLFSFVCVARERTSFFPVPASPTATRRINDPYTAAGAAARLEVQQFPASIFQLASCETDRGIESWVCICREQTGKPVLRARQTHFFLTDKQTSKSIKFAH